MMHELDAQVLEARFDPKVHVIVLTGAGKAPLRRCGHQDARGSRSVFQV